MADLERLTEAQVAEHVAVVFAAVELVGLPARDALAALAADALIVQKRQSAALHRIAVGAGKPRGTH